MAGGHGILPIRPLLRWGDTIPFDQNVIGYLVAEWMRPSPKHVVDGNLPRVSNDAWRCRVAKQGLQSSDIKIKKPLGSVIDLVTGRVVEKIRPVSVNEALPGGSAKAAIQPGTPTVWNIAGTRDQPVDRHTKGKVDDDLELLGPSKCLQRSPVEVGA